MLDIKRNLQGQLVLAFIISFGLTITGCDKTEQVKELNSQVQELKEKNRKLKKELEKYRSENKADVSEQAATLRDLIVNDGQTDSQ